MFIGELEHAMLKTLAYSDIFDFPLRLDEIHRYLPVRASHEEVLNALTFTMHGYVGADDGYYFLAGREEIIEIRKQREKHSHSLIDTAIKYGRILGSLPFVRMVGLTGSLAVRNVSKDFDFDYMLVTAPGRLWTARAFALLFNRATKRFGHTICPNLIVAETALEWRQHDLYSARELCQMIPITGMDTYRQLIEANTWTKDFLPNVFMESSASPRRKEIAISEVFQKTLEIPLRGKVGNGFEQWEMDRKVARFSKQDGFGEETVFTTEVCQGNFDHHRRWTQKALLERMSNIDRLGTSEKRIGQLA